MNNIDKPNKIVHKELSYKIIGALYEVYNALGYGYKEKVYEKALCKILQQEGMAFKNQVPYKLYFKGEYLGIYYLDLLIDERVIVELKQGNNYSSQHFKQVKEYLKITNLKLAILANFTPSGVKYIRVLNLY